MNTNSINCDIEMNGCLDNSITLKKQKINLRDEFSTFLKCHTVYETIPENMKILVFNNELSIKDAIEAMIKEDIYCGLIWDSEQNKFIGLFTIRDFLNLMKVIHDKIKIHFENNGKWTNVKKLVSELFHKVKASSAELDEIIEDEKYFSESKSDKSDVNEMIIDSQEVSNNTRPTVESTLKNYKEFFRMFDYISISEYIINIHPDNCLHCNLISISLDGHLKDCIDLMRTNHIHRVIVEEIKSAQFTGFITYETIFEYFIANYYSDMTAFHIPIEHLNIVSKNLITLDKNETIYNCLECFWFHKISILPIYDNDTKEIFGFFFLKDIVYFFTNGEKFSVMDYLLYLTTPIFLKKV